MKWLSIGSFEWSSDPAGYWIVKTWVVDGVKFVLWANFTDDSAGDRKLGSYDSLDEAKGMAAANRSLLNVATVLELIERG